MTSINQLIRDNYLLKKKPEKNFQFPPDKTGKAEISQESLPKAYFFNLKNTLSFNRITFR